MEKEHSYVDLILFLIFLLLEILLVQTVIKIQNNFYFNVYTKKIVPK